MTADNAWAADLVANREWCLSCGTPLTDRDNGGFGAERPCPMGCEPEPKCPEANR